jgi:chorismate mutase
LNTLDDVRIEIDATDKEIIKLIAKRIELVKEVATIKHELQLPALDSTRWQKVIESRIQLGKELELSEELIIKIYDAIHEEALKIEKSIIQKDSEKN